jgi:hypothetical protein
MAKIYLTAQDKELIERLEGAYKTALEAFETVERAKQFKMDDYLILLVSDDDGVMQVSKNSYGAPIKYKVVHISDRGIPFIKVTNKKGSPIGKLYSSCGAWEDTYRLMGQKFKFELDPDFADSLLLQDEYDPAQLHKSKMDIWKAVTEHNKKCRVATQELKDVVSFFKQVNVGDILWTSNNGFLLVQDKKTMSPGDFNRGVKYRYQTRQRGPFVTVLTVRDKSGKVKDITADTLWNRALYRERPRTYKELNI